MTALPIAFHSNSARYKFIGDTQLVNAYAEKAGSDAKGPLAVIPCDGIVELIDVASGPGRGLIYMEDLDKLYSVHPSSVYKITNEDGVLSSTRIGTVPGNDPVQLSRNQKSDPQITVRSDAGLQVIETDSISYILDEDLPDEDAVTSEYVGGYTLVGYADRRFFNSSLESSKFYDALDFATFEQRAGVHKRIVESNGELVSFNSTWLEYWRKVADEDFPFAPMGFKNVGLKATSAVIRSDNTLMFPTHENNVVRLNNYDPQIISSHELSRLIRDDANAEDMLGFGWSNDGHAFAALTGSNWTRCYDSATQVWHSRQSYGRDIWRARHCVKAWGMDIVQDALTGKLGRLAKDTYAEYGGAMLWKVISPPMHAFPNGGICDALHLDLATGYGTLSGQGSNPKIMLRVSRDGGNTFGGYRELELGVRGKYATRVTARRLGKFGPKGMVFEISISDPVARALVNVDAEVRPLKR